tara:strand:- start:126 stop:911 length:786 start_codon:yes stop_codon:yes gene_type:complete
VTIIKPKLEDLPIKLEHSLFIKGSYYRYTYQMYESIPKSWKHLFSINLKLISKSILNLSKTKYATIHIRYGDKLCYAEKDGLGKKLFNYKHTNYPIYSPSYYIESIKKLRKEQFKVVILTDSPNIVNRFIIQGNFDTDLEVVLPSIGYVESFFLLIHSSYSIMSISTFSYMASYINSNVPNILVLDGEEHFGSINAIDPKWTIIVNPKVILNNDQKMVKQMIKNYKKCQEFEKYWIKKFGRKPKKKIKKKIKKKTKKKNNQ